MWDDMIAARAFSIATLNPALPPIPEEKEELVDEEVPATPKHAHEEEIPATQLDTLSPAYMTPGSALAPMSPGSTLARSPAPKMPEACPKKEPKTKTRKAAKEKACPKKTCKTPKAKACPKSTCKTTKKKASPKKTYKARKNNKGSKDDPRAVPKKLASAFWLQKLPKTKVDKDADAHFSFSEWRVDFYFEN